MADVGGDIAAGEVDEVELLEDATAGYPYDLRSDRPWAGLWSIYWARRRFLAHGRNAPDPAGCSQTPQLVGIDAVSRSVHLVGAVPGESAQEAMTAALDRLAPHLRSLSDGETGTRSWWIRASLDRLRDNPDVELVRDGDYSSYEATPQWRVKEGRQLTVENLEPCLVAGEAFDSSYPLFRELRERYGRPDLDFQVGVPLHLDLAVDGFGEAGFAPPIYEPCLEATAREVRAIQSRSRGDVVFQLEMPVPLIAIASAPDEAQPQVAAQMADRIIELPLRTEAGTRYGVHLCLGDMNHRALAAMRNVRPLVLLSNELASRWPADRPLEFIHAPFAAAEVPPTFAEEFYAPLGELEIPDGLRFAAGCVHESLSLQEQRDLLAMIERFAGRQVDLAAACGLGRRPDPAQAWDAMDKSAALVDA